MRIQEIELYLVSFLTRVVLVIVAAYFALVGIIGIVGLSSCKVIVYEIKLNF
jgi:hypothetical protein